MKILQLCKYYPPDVGGMESSIGDITEAVSRKVKCDVLCSNTANRTVVEQRNGYSVTRIASFGEFFSTPVSLVLPKILKKAAGNYDIIHLHLPNPMANLAYFLVRPKTKLVIHWHSDIIRQKYLMALYLPLQNWLLKKADRIIVTSPVYLEGSIYLKKYRSKCTVIPLGIDDAKLNKDVNKAKDLKSKYAGNPIVLFVGRLIYYKGIEYLVEAMRDVDARLLVVGQGYLEAKIRRRIAELGLENKIFMIGRVGQGELGSYYEACDVFCLPSVHKSEAFGLVQAEAMSFSKPVVSTKIAGSGVGWVNQNQKTGFVVPPKNSKALASALNRLLTDSDLRVNFGENARHRFGEEFTSSLMAARVMKLYEEII